MGYGKKYIFDLVDRCDSFVQFLKLEFVRVRPYDLSDELNLGVKAILDKPRTGAYPSGHSYDAWIVVHDMVKRHGEHRIELEKMALKIGESRMIGGLHYPSDLEAGRMAAEVAVKIDNLYEEVCGNS